MLRGFICTGTRELTVRGWKKEDEKVCSLVQDLEEDAGLKRKRARLANDIQLGTSPVVCSSQSRRCTDFGGRCASSSREV